MKYLVYNNPEGTKVDFVRDTDGTPRVYSDVDMAQECANKETNGYVVPLGMDIIDFVARSVTWTSDLELENEGNKILQQI